MVSSLISHPPPPGKLPHTPASSAASFSDSETRVFSDPETRVFSDPETRVDPAEAFEAPAGSAVAGNKNDRHDLEEGWVVADNFFSEDPQEGSSSGGEGSIPALSVSPASSVESGRSQPLNRWSQPVAATPETVGSTKSEGVKGVVEEERGAGAAGVSGVVAGVAVGMSMDYIAPPRGIIAPPRYAS